MQNCILVSSRMSIASYDCKIFLEVHTILQNNLLDMIPNVYNVKQTSGFIDIPVKSENGGMWLLQ